MDENIIRKIRHLLELAKSPNEHEAALATQRVQELLSQYNLDMATIDASRATQKTQDAPGGKRGKTSHQGSALYHYQRTLMAAICGNNFVYHMVQTGWKPDPRGKKVRWLYDQPQNVNDANRNDMGRVADTHILIGREENVIGTQCMYDYLIETMDRLLPWQGMEKRGKDALLWLAGCTDRLVGRLIEQRWESERVQDKKAREQRDKGEVGIVLASVYASESDYNDDVRFGLELGTTARRRQENSARYAADAAKEAQLVANGCPIEDAYYIARGLNPPSKITAPKKEETEAERIKREAKEQREDDRWEAKRDRERSKEREKQNHPAFRAGQETGRNIGLNDQVKGRNQEQIR